MKSQEVAPRTKLARKAAYTLAAGAAAGTTAMTAAEADAEIIFSGERDVTINQGFFYGVDMDLDGDYDLALENFNFGTPYQGGLVYYAPGNFAGFFANGIGYASALGAGELIDATTTTGGPFDAVLAFGPNPNSEFDNADGAYIGVEFADGLDVFYGWIRVTIDNAAGTFVINSWASNSVAGEGIEAGRIPEPGALGLLAAGAAGLAALRTRRNRD